MNIDLFIQSISNEQGLIPRRCNQSWLEKNNLWDFLLENTKDFGRESTVKEKIVFLKTKQNRCKVCNSITKLNSKTGNEFNLYCSSKCYHSTEEAKEQLKLHNENQRKNIELSKELLEDLYINKQMNVLQISKQLDLSNVTIQSYITKFGIPTRTHKENQKLNYQQHPRPYSGYSVSYDPAELTYSYTVLKKPVSQIALDFNCHKESVRRFLISLDIKRINRQSKIEWMMMNFLDELKIDYIMNCKKIISDRDIDFWIPSFNIGIEINGLFIHRFFDGLVPKRPGKTKDYHYNKFKDCSDKGIRLFQFFENDILERFDIIKNMIKSNLGFEMINLNARKYKIAFNMDKDLIKKFYEENHIQGNPSQRSKSISLISGDEIIAALSFEQSGDIITITRFCTKLGCRVRGAYSRLESYLPECKKIITYSSNAISQGDLYKANGYECVAENLDLFVTDFKTVFNRRKFQKKRMKDLFGDNFDPSKTEIENIQNNKMGVIWGAGIKTWVKTK